jgi:hypothetical protein
MNINWSRWVHPGKIRYAPYEWFVMRLLLGYVMFSSFKQSGYHPFKPWLSIGRGVDYTTQPYPRSIAQFVDVTWITQPANIPYIAGTLGVLLVIYMLGIAPVLAMGALLAMQVCVGALEHSQGNNTWHSTHLLAFCMIGVLGSALTENLGALKRGGIKGLWAHCAERYQWLAYVLKTPASWWRKASNPMESRQETSRSFTIYIVQQLIAAAYMVAGISKLWISKGMWMIDVQNIGLQFEKSRWQKYYQSLEQPDVVPWAAGFVNSHPIFTSVFFSTGLLLELLCFVALFNRAYLGIFGVSLFLMHLLIQRFMTLNFYYNEWMVIIFFINIPFWVVWGYQRVSKQPLGMGILTSEPLRVND